MKKSAVKLSKRGHGEPYWYVAVSPDVFYSGLGGRHTNCKLVYNYYMGLINKVDMVCLSPVGYGV